MRKWFPILFLLLILSGCGRQTPDPGLSLRSRILEGCCFDAEITADYGDSLSVFSVACEADSRGQTTFTVTAPESIAGISGTLAAGTGKLLFEDKALAFPLLADGLLTPAAAPWIFVRTLRSGNLIAAGQEGAETRLSIDDSFREDALRLDIWLDQAGDPVRADICYAGQRYLSMNITNFRTEPKEGA